MNYYQLLNDGRNALVKAGKEKVDAQHLLFFLMKWTIADYLRDQALEVSLETERMYRELLVRRLAGVPVQEIVGSQNFYGYEIAVSPDVLTPRPETEQLVELTLAEIADRKQVKVLDLCTGSGCIAIAMAAENRGVQVTAVDISTKALELAKRNGKKNEVNRRIRWLKSNLFEEVEERAFDIIISNPPYIPTAEIASLEIEVKKYDPLLALDGGADGLFFYREIGKKGGNYIKDGGKLFLEIGDEQGMAVKEILWQEGWQEIQILHDYSGRQRIVTAVRKKFEG